jgi:hypothetical protein
MWAESALFHGVFRRVRIIGISEKVKSPTMAMSRFNDALRSVLQVSKSNLDEIRTQEKGANADKPKRRPKPKASGHALSDKD